MQRLARLREEIQAIDHERQRVAAQLAAVVSGLDIARAEMFAAFSALRHVTRLGEGAHTQVRRDDARHLRDAYEVRKREWSAVVQRERALRARLTVLDAGKTERLREHRRIYQGLTVRERHDTELSDPDQRPRASA